MIQKPVGKENNSTEMEQENNGDEFFVDAELIARLEDISKKKEKKVRITEDEGMVSFSSQKSQHVEAVVQERLLDSIKHSTILIVDKQIANKYMRSS